MKPITQKIIDKYNEGQDELEVVLIYIGDSKGYLLIRDKKQDKKGFDITICDFLTNPEYGFAKAYWGDDEVCQYCGHNPGDKDRFAVCNNCIQELDTEFDLKLSWQYHLQQMVISENWIKYIEDHL